MNLITAKEARNLSDIQPPDVSSKEALLEHLSNLIYRAAMDRKRQILSPLPERLVAESASIQKLLETEGFEVEVINSLYHQVEGINYLIKW